MNKATYQSDGPEREITRKGAAAILACAKKNTLNQHSSTTQSAIELRCT